jgi:hypothetical protein
MVYQVQSGRSTFGSPQAIVESFDKKVETRLRELFAKQKGAAMKNEMKMCSAALLLVVGISVPIFAARQEKRTDKSVASNPAESNPEKPNAEKQHAENPGAAEMLRLQFYLGEWGYTETYPKSAAAPNGAVNTGVYTSKLGPGGNSLINTFHSQGPVGDFEGLLIMTWDTKEKSYKEYVFGNDFPGALVGTGQFEGDALVFRSELAAGGATFKLRNVTRVVAPGKLTSDEYMAKGDAPESLLVHVEATKRK